jgi:hypothetical protein
LLCLCTSLRVAQPTSQACAGVSALPHILSRWISSSRGYFFWGVLIFENSCTAFPCSCRLLNLRVIDSNSLTSEAHQRFYEEQRTYSLLCFSFFQPRIHVLRTIAPSSNHLNMARQIVLASILSLSTLGAAQKDNGGECDCFKTNGSTEAYFTYHRFFDYRNVPSALTSHPKVLTDASDTSNARNSSAFFSQPSWTSTWAAQNWDNSDSLNTSNSDAAILMINSPNNVYIGIFSRGFPSQKNWTAD